MANVSKKVVYTLIDNLTIEFDQNGWALFSHQMLTSKQVYEATAAMLDFAGNTKNKRQVSAEHRAKLSVAQKKRYEKVRVARSNLNGFITS